MRCGKKGNKPKLKLNSSFAPATYFLPAAKPSGPRTVRVVVVLVVGGGAVCQLSLLLWYTLAS